MLPEKFSKQDLTWVKKNSQMNLKEPKDLEKYVGSDFTSLYFLKTDLEKIKNILSEIYKMNEDLIRNKTSYENNSDLINSFIGDVLNLGVFEVLNFELNPKDKSIWVKLKSKRSESPFEIIVPISRGVFVSEENSKELNEKSNKILKHLENLFYKGFGKRISL